jgi:hypothetical protein
MKRLTLLVSAIVVLAALGLGTSDTAPNPKVTAAKAARGRPPEPR